MPPKTMGEKKRTKVELDQCHIGNRRNQRTPFNTDPPDRSS